MQGNEGSSSGVTRYVVRSSDVLEDMRINVSAEGSDKVIWYKERFLTDDEILEHIVDNATSTILWTVHRPKRGWYIRLRPPSFPQGVFIPLLPLPQTSPYFADAALSFSCRTSLPPTRSAALTQHPTDSEVTLTDGATPREQHSYPPTPPTNPVVVVNPPSPGSVHAKLDSVSLSSPPLRVRPLVQSAVTHFVVTPRVLAPPPEQAAQASIFSRLFAAIKSNAPSHDYSFTLAPIRGPPTSPTTPGPASPGAGRPGQGVMGAGTLTPAPLLTFHDRTPVWTARCSSGLVELDEGQCRVLGVDPVFYVAVALTYLEFLEERESYLVAAHD